jgi:Peptidase family M3
MKSFLKDVVRTGSLKPSNPILEALEFPKVNGKSQPLLSESSLSHLPKFSAVSPYHLETAAKHVLGTFQMQLAELEMKLSTSEEEGQSSPPPPTTVEWLLSEMDRVQSPVNQIREVSTLYTSLAANPDQIQAWKDAVASPSVKMVLAMTGESSPIYRCSIIYQALVKAFHPLQENICFSSSSSSSSYFLPFHKQGMHLVSHNSSTDSTNQQEQLQQIHQDLQVVQERLHNIVSYHHASKAVRLQCVSDMYNCLGLSRMQAQVLGLVSVRDMSQQQHHHMMMMTMPTPFETQWHVLCQEVSHFSTPFLSQNTKLNLDGAGAFLDDANRPGNVAAGTSDQQMAVLKARYRFKQCMRLKGVLQGLIDFCDAILGLHIVQDAVAENEGWNKNVRLLHVYEKIDEVNTNGSKESTQYYLGTIYFDPFADAYWRTDEAQELVMTRLYSQSIHQTVAPVVILALKIRPTWDDAPVPVGWDDTRGLLFHFGMALQMILGQASKQRNITSPKPPIDTSEFLGHVSCEIRRHCHLDDYFL